MWYFGSGKVKTLGKLVTLVPDVVWLYLWSQTPVFFESGPDTFDEKEFSTVWGIPSWLFWGIAVPWLLADVFTLWFCFFYMKDGDLGEDDPPEAETVAGEVSP